MKKCFVISPISSEGSDIRRHADEVFKYLISPAMDKVGIEPIRSDHMAKTGSITKQMIEAILNYDLCVAVLTFENPNVYYELAIAQCAVRPVIILIEKGTLLPFDVKDERTIFYDLSITSYDSRIHINKLVNILNSFEAQNWEIESSVPGFCAPSERTSSGLQYYERRKLYGAEKPWSDIITSTNEYLHFLGLNLNNWKKVPEFEEKLLNKARSGCKIKILLYHQDNPALKEHIDTDSTVSGSDGFDVMCVLIEKNYNYFSEIAQKHKNIEIKQVTKGAITHFQALNDEYALYNPYFYSIKSTYAPLWVIAKEENFYMVLKKEFETLWDAN